MPRVDEHIRRAMEEGSFDDLPGKGQPLRLDENPLEDPNWRLANHVLRSSGFTLSWIEARQEIHSEVEATRLALARAWSSFKASRENNQSLDRMEAEWKRAQQLFDEEIARLNQRIAD